MKLFDKLMARFISPFVYPRLAERAFRERLYLNSGRKWFPFRGALVEIIEKRIADLLVYGESVWGKEAGVLYDLKHRLYNKKTRHHIYQVHYLRTLQAFQFLWEKYPASAVVDYGCGPGILTEYLRQIVDGNVPVYGLDIRPETLSYNRKLGLNINWCNLAELDRILGEKDFRSVAMVVDGVVNFLNETELIRLLSFPKIIFAVFYFSNPLNVNLEVISSNLGYNSRFKEYPPTVDGGPTTTVFYIFKQTKSETVK